MTWMGRGARSLQHQARLWQEVVAKILRERRGSNQEWRRLPIDKPGQLHQPSLAIVLASCYGMIEYNFLHKMKTYETSATLVFKAILRCLSPNSTKCEKYRDFSFHLLILLARFVLYWRTTTATSTSTSYTATSTLASITCTPNGFPLSVCG